MGCGWDLTLAFRTAQWLDDVADVALGELHNLNVGMLQRQGDLRG